MADQPLIINEWADAIGDSPHTGLGLVQNASIDAVKGAVMPNYQPGLNSFAAASSTGSMNNGTGLFTLNTVGTSLETDGVAVTFSTAGGGTLDTAITAGTVYFLYKSSTGVVVVADTLAHAIAHSPMALNGNASGTVTVATVNMGTPNSIAQMSGVVFVADSNGRVWFDEGTKTYLLKGNTLTNGTGHGLATFVVSDASLTYLFVYRNQKIDVFDVTTQAKRRDPAGTSSYTDAWQNLANGSGYTGSHQALHSQNNLVYSCDGIYLNSIQEVPGKVFNPGDSTTYVYQQKAYQLPAGSQTQCLEQLNVNLLVGDLNSQNIYPIDLSTTQQPGLGVPIICPEVGVYAMKNIGNTIWILNGLRGIIYNTTGYLVVELRKLPEWLMQSTSGASNLVTWGGVAAKNGAFMFGVSPLNTTYAAIYLLYPDGKLVLENTPSLGASLPTVLSQGAGEFYYSGYAGGLDLVTTSRYSALPGAIVQSRLYMVGNKISKATYSRLEVQLDQPGAAGGQVRVSWRAGLSGSWTVLDTYTLDGTATSFSTDVGLTNLENIQIQVEIASAGTGSNATRVREVRLF